MTERNGQIHAAPATENGVGLTRRQMVGATALAAIGAHTLLAGEQPTSQPAEWPCLAVWHNDGLPPPGKELNSGLGIAVWPDGAILFSPWPGRLGQYLLTGTVDKVDLKEMLAAIRRVGFFEANRDYIVIDSSFTTIAVRDDQGSSVHAFHESLMPGFGGDLNTDAAYRRFVRAWRHTRGAIEALMPVRIERLGDRKEFRGYYVDKWYATTWRDERRWKGKGDQ